MLPLLLAVLARAAGGDEPLLRKIAGGDARALRVLYDRCASLTLALAVRILRSRAEAEEVVQEAFLEAWRSAGRYDPRRGTAISWILSIARSRALDRVRSRGAAARAIDALGREEPAPMPMPVESAEARQDRDRIRASLSALPADQRNVLELAYFEGLTQTEIAERTGTALGTVKTRCRLALQKLAQLMESGR